MTGSKWKPAARATHEIQRSLRLETIEFVVARATSVSSLTSNALPMGKRNDAPKRGRRQKKCDHVNNANSSGKQARTQSPDYF